MKKKIAWIAVVVSIIFAFSFLATAQEREQERDREMFQLRQQLAQDTPLSSDDMAAIEPELEKYMLQHREREQLQETIRFAYELGCRGSCLAEMVRSMNQAMSKGLTAVQSREICCEALQKTVQETKRTRSQLGDDDLKKQLRKQVEIQLASREQHRSQPAGRSMGKGSSAGTSGSSGGGGAGNGGSGGGSSGGGGNK